MTLVDIKNRFTQLCVVHEDTYKETEPLIRIESVRLKEALKNQIDLQLSWEVLTKKFNKLYDICELTMESAYSDAISAELKNAYKSTTITEAREYAKADQSYKDAKRLLIEIREVRDEARGILDTVQSRKYILNNMTNALVASVDNTIL